MPSASSPAAAALFGAASTTALVAWVALAASLVAPPLRRWTWRGTGVLVPALLAVGYGVALTIGVRTGDPAGGFGSIGAVRALFANDFALAAGWLHYLAFDLIVGTWIARTGTAASLHPALLLPCLALTFLAGPVGWLAYVALRVLLRPRAWEGLA